MNLIEQAKAAKEASVQLRTLDITMRNSILSQFADALEENAEAIITANSADMKASEEKGMSTAMLDRLKLDEKRITGMAEGIRDVIRLDDPLHIILEERTLASGVRLQKITVPMGVIGIIFESRPNVTADCIALCFKAGSACVLKGGKESYASCRAITDLFKDIAEKNGISPDCVMLGERPSHEETAAFMACREYVDLLIPRGGKNLIRSVVDNAKVPVIETGAGVCHTFIDESADMDKAPAIIINAKCSRPSVCNAMETLLVHENISEADLSMILHALHDKDVRIIGDETVCRLDEKASPADEASWHTEYNDLILNVRIVRDVQEAVRHIEKYGTHHSDCIITEDTQNAQFFLDTVDSACVYHNASTRFTDGFEFGLGAEIGISTQKLHARGPMGLRELTSYAYRLTGNGEIR